MMDKTTGDLVYPHAEVLAGPPIALGCMHMGGAWDASAPISQETLAKARAAVEAALELGWNFFDHADIYCRGKSETVFAKVIRELRVPREDIILQSKCGIRFPDDPSPGNPHRFDFSAGHIETSVEGSLQRLKTDYLDVLLLHRPDLLSEPEEILTAFDNLRNDGKVRHFGVSNFPPHLLELFADAGFVPVANQVELSLLRTSLFDDDVVASRRMPATGHPADGTLAWHRRHGVVTQAWAPLAYGYPSGRKPDWEHERVHATANVVREVATVHDAPPEAVVIAFLLRHPAGIQPIVGSRNPERLRACDAARRIRLSREEWYRLYLAGRGEPLP